MPSDEDLEAIEAYWSFLQGYVRGAMLVKNPITTAKLAEALKQAIAVLNKD
jgi:hypothetical protein